MVRRKSLQHPFLIVENHGGFKVENAITGERWGYVIYGPCALECWSGSSLANGRGHCPYLFHSRRDAIKAIENMKPEDRP